MQRVTVIGALVTVMACGGSKSPTTPTPPTPPPAPTSVISISGNLAFGSVVVGESRALSFTITNSGTAPLTVTSVQAPDSFHAQSTASWFQGTIPAGASQVVTITFKPTAPGDHSGVITVVGNQTSGTNTISFSARGTSPSPPPPPPPTPTPPPPSPSPTPTPPPPGGATALLLFGGPNDSGSVFLGCLNCGRFDSSSVCSQFGDFGSRFAARSIWNRFGDYGSRFSNTSPWNRFASSAPKIVDTAGRFYGYFTSNRFLTPRTTNQFFLSFLDNVDLVNEDLDAARDAFCE